MLRSFQPFLRRDRQHKSMATAQKFGASCCVRILLALAACIFTARSSAAQENVPPPATSAGQPRCVSKPNSSARKATYFSPTAKLKSNTKIYVCVPNMCSTTRKRTWSAARGNVQLDVETQHITADSADFNVQSGEGVFDHVHGEVTMEHRPNSNMLVSPNPLVFEAQQVRRLDARTYTIEHAWLTVCEPDKPSWKFYRSPCHAARRSHGGPGQRQLPDVPHSASVHSLRVCCPRDANCGNRDC